MSTYLLVITVNFAHRSFVVNADVTVESMNIGIIRLAEADATKRYKAESCVVTNVIKMES